MTSRQTLVIILIATVSSLACALSPASGEIPSLLKPEYVERVDSADHYLRREQWAEAERCLIQALEIDPANFSNSMIHCNLGIIKSRLGDVEGAIESFSLGLRIAPSSTTLLSNRARSYLGADMRAEALADLDKIIEIGTAEPWARKMRGMVNLSYGNLDSAIADFNLIDSPDADTLRSLAFCYQARGDADRALEAYDRLIAMSPTDEAYADRALFFLLADKTSEAGDDIREGLKINNKNGNLYLLRAYIERKMHLNDASDIDKKLAIEYGADRQLIEMLFPENGKKK